MQLISKYNKGTRSILCVIDLFSKYAWVALLKYKKGITIFNTFQNISDCSKRNPNKIWVYQGSEFYNKCFKKWLEDNDIKKYLTYNKGKSVVAEGFIRTSKNNIYKHITAVSKNVYFDLLYDIVDNYNNSYHHTTIETKPINVNLILIINTMLILLKKILNLK